MVIVLRCLGVLSFLISSSEVSAPASSTVISTLPLLLLRLTHSDREQHQTPTPLVPVLLPHHWLCLCTWSQWPHRETARWEEEEKPFWRLLLIALLPSLRSRGEMEEEAAAAIVAAGSDCHPLLRYQIPRPVRPVLASLFSS